MGDLLPDGAGEVRSGLWDLFADFRRLKQRKTERSLLDGEATIVTVELRSVDPSEHLGVVLGSQKDANRVLGASARCA